MSRKSPMRRVLSLESLEGRQLCAGASLAPPNAVPCVICQPSASGGPRTPTPGNNGVPGPAQPPAPPPVDPPPTVAPRNEKPDIAVVGVRDGQAEPVFVGWGYTSNPAERIFQIRNSGKANLEITRITASDGFLVTGLVHPIVLQPGQSYYLSVRLTATAGEKVGMISIRSNDPNEGNFNFPVVGRVFTPPRIAPTNAGLLHPNSNGVFRDYDMREARKIEIGPPHGNVPLGTRYVVTVVLTDGRKHSYAIGGNPSRILFKRAAPPEVYNYYPNLDVRFGIN